MVGDPGVKHRDDGWWGIPGRAGMDDEQLQIIMVSKEGE